MGRLNPIERRLERFLREPTSVRNAASVIIIATAVVVVAAGVVITLIDSNECPNLGVGLWWALQTVTTVGYGDVTPTQLGGRLVGVFVMLEGTAFIAIVTAVITSTFVTRATRDYEAHATEQASDRKWRSSGSTRSSASSTSSRRRTGTQEPGNDPGRLQMTEVPHAQPSAAASGVAGRPSLWQRVVTSRASRRIHSGLLPVSDLR